MVLSVTANSGEKFTLGEEIRYPHVSSKDVVLLKNQGNPIIIISIQRIYKSENPTYLIEGSRGLILENGDEKIQKYRITITNPSYVFEILD